MKKVAPVLVTAMALAIVGQAWALVAPASIKERVKRSDLVALGTVKKVEEARDGEEKVTKITLTVKEAMKGEAGETIEIQQSVNKRNSKPSVGTELIYFLKKAEGHYVLAMGNTVSSTARKEEAEEVRKAIKAE